MKKLLFISFIFLLNLSCKSDLDYKISGYTQKIIVEGYISNGEFPKVYLTLNFPLSQRSDSTIMIENVIRSAKVTVSDGETSEILTSGWDTDKRHYPPYLYAGTELKGQEGKTYYLTVEYGGYTLSASTTIPSATNIEQFDFLPVVGKDNMKSMFMTLNIKNSLTNSYRVFTRKRKDGYYLETPFVYNAEFTLSGLNNFIISPKVSKVDSSYSESGYFKKGDTILVKLCTIDSVSTQFFKGLTLFSSETGVGNDLFIGEKDKLKSNISEPGFGIWYGNGVKYYSVIIP